MNIEMHDIVQITDPDHHWYPCLIVVDEVRSWGIQGHLNIPQDNLGNVAATHIRLPNDVFTKVGRVQVGPC